MKTTIQSQEEHLGKTYYTVLCHGHLLEFPADSEAQAIEKAEKFVEKIHFTQDYIDELELDEAWREKEKQGSNW